MGTQKVVIRCVKSTDLEAILEISSMVGHGFTSLPNDKKVIEHKIDSSLKSILRKNEKNASFFFFVMEDLDSKQVVGTAAIEGRAGYPWPFYNYKVSTIAHLCESLKKYNEHRVLYWVNDYQNSSKFGTLYLKPDYRGAKNGELLSRSRSLFVAEYPDQFCESIIANMFAVVSEEGKSPFWKSIGHHFTGLTFKEADYLRTVRGTQFISDLMPQYPIYVDLLSKHAREVIGCTREETKPALHVLEKEGFKYRQYIDIFDGGPVLEAYKSELKTIHTSRCAKIKNCKKNLSESEAILMMICNTDIDYRATKGLVQITSECSVNIDVETARALNVSVGDRIRFSPFR